MAKNNKNFKIVKYNRNRAMIKCVFINVMRGNDVKTGGNFYELTPEIQKALIETIYEFDEMSDNDILTFSRILYEINYDPKTDRKSKRREYIRNELPSRVQKVLNPPIAEIESGGSDKY